VVEEFHQRCPQKAGPLENGFGGPQTKEGDIVTVRSDTKAFRAIQGGEEGIVLQKDGDVGRHGGCGALVVV